MKVLFVSSGNHAGGISPITFRQGESLKQAGVSVSYFTMRGRGLRGYLASVVPLRRHIRQWEPDVVHAHFVLSGFVAAIASKPPVVVSLMGSDLQERAWMNRLIRFFCRRVWQGVIVKSDRLRQAAACRKVVVIPNGVDPRVFFPSDRLDAGKRLGWSPQKVHIVFGADPRREEKNFPLAETAIALTGRADQELHILSGVEPAEVPLWLQAAHVVLLTSRYEGSPNVIKEAMACGRPVVTTDVGDVRQVLQHIPGCFVVEHDPSAVAHALGEAIRYSLSHSHTCGPERINLLGLDAASVAAKLVKVYESVREERKQD